MNEDFGGDILTVSDDEGNQYELELLDELAFEGKEYCVFVPANIDEMDVDDPDYGLIFLARREENGEEVFDSVDDEELLERMYEYYQELMDEEEAGEAPEQ